EGGHRPAEGADALASTIVDATAVPLRVVRQGAISLARLREVVPGLVDVDGNAPSAPAAGTTAPPPAESGAEPSAESAAGTGTE
ncbi:MAG TPA: threonylcarbamoyl-AMP synthase, partial [Arthrobacter sp.]|nr:threonylcarbamoyl-AMP synthase [Arthrobacter sp.]